MQRKNCDQGLVYETVYAFYVVIIPSVFVNFLYPPCINLERWVYYK